MSDPVRPQRRQPTRLPHPWDSPGKNIGVGCHFLLQCRKVKSERSHSVVSASLQPHGLKPTRLLRPWDFPGKSTGVGCHCLLQSHILSTFNSFKCNNLGSVAAKSLQSCPTLCDPTDGSPPGSPIPGILQARTLEWVAISFSSAGK